MKTTCKTESARIMEERVGSRVVVNIVEYQVMEQ